MTEPPKVRVNGVIAGIVLVQCFCPSGASLWDERERWNRSWRWPRIVTPNPCV